MSVAVCRGPMVVPPAFEAPRWLKLAAEPYKPAAEPVAAIEPCKPTQVDIWKAIQADVDANKKAAKKEAAAAYVHPLARRSSSRLLSQKSLEVCTESLGNETGSGDFTASLDCLFDAPPPAAAMAETEEDSFWWENGGDRAEEEDCAERKDGEELAAVNYHRCSSAARRAFPPPLPSISRRDGPCVQMRPRREGGRLVVEAVAVRPRGFLHATRQGGCLRLAFVECSASARCQQQQQSAAAETEITATAAAAASSYFPVIAEAEPRKKEQEEEEEAAMEMEEGEEEEEVEVVDRGTVVEVKVMSTQPQTPTSGAKVHRSRLVINKFVGGAPLAADQQQPPHRQQQCDIDTTTADAGDEAAPSPPAPKLRRVPSSTTTLAAAVAQASSGTDDDDEPAPEEDDEDGGDGVFASAAAAPAEPKQLLLFTSRRGDKQDILRSVRRCRQLRQKPLFILEPYCVATT